MANASPKDASTNPAALPPASVARAPHATPASAPANPYTTPHATSPAMAAAPGRPRETREATAADARVSATPAAPTAHGGTPGCQRRRASTAAIPATRIVTWDT